MEMFIVHKRYLNYIQILVFFFFGSSKIEPLCGIGNCYSCLQFVKRSMVDSQCAIKCVPFFSQSDFNLLSHPSAFVLRLLAAIMISTFTCGLSCIFNHIVLLISHYDFQSKKIFFFRFYYSSVPHFTICILKDCIRMINCYPLLNFLHSFFIVTIRVGIFLPYYRVFLIYKINIVRKKALLADENIETRLDFRWTLNRICKGLKICILFCCLQCSIIDFVEKKKILCMGDSLKSLYTRKLKNNLF